MARTTSVRTFKRIKKNGLLSKSRLEVYEALYNNGPCTAGQLFKNLKNVIVKGSVCARLTELRQRGCAMEIGTTKCPVTGQNAALWDVTKDLPTEPTKVKETRAAKLARLENNTKELSNSLKWAVTEVKRQATNSKGVKLARSWQRWLQRAEDALGGV